MALKFFQVDAFTSKPFAGNPAAVMPLQEWLPDETLLAIAAEHNLAETAYFVPKGEDFHLRWFTPTVEMPLCGHATLASAYVVFNHLERARDKVVFHTQSGALTVTRDGDRLMMDFPTRPNEPAAASEIAPVAEAIGARLIELRRGWTYLAVVESEDIVRNLKPDIAKIAALPLDVVVTARGAKADFVSRVFVPKRGGELWLRLEGDRVKMAGHAVLTVTGEVHI